MPYPDTHTCWVGIDTSNYTTSVSLAVREPDAPGRLRVVSNRKAPLPVAPGARVRFAGEAGQWRVTGWKLEHMLVVLRLRRIVPDALPARAGDPGQVAREIDLPAGATRLVAFEAPPGEVALAAPRILVAAAGGTGWRRAALSIGDDAGGWEAAGDIAAPAVIGRVTRPPSARASAAIEDRGSVAEVELLHAGMALGNADAAALDRGANAAMLGDELVQFGRAEQIGERRWRLSRLWRGRRGTEAAIADQRVGAVFVLMDEARLIAIDRQVPVGRISLQASGIADAAPVHAQAVVAGRSLLPPAPVHLRGHWHGERLHIDWVRRSRTGWMWRDMIDTPLAEEREEYRVTLLPSSALQPPVSFVSSMPRLVLPTDQVPPDAAAVTVCQLGTHGASAIARYPLPERTPS